MPRLILETGNRYGKLLVLERAKSTTSGASWLCLCDCGKHTVVEGGHLRTGHTRSCGCFSAIDETGNQYSRLKVLKRVENINGRPGWLCQCDCGKYVKVLGQSLRNGTTRSCGCLRAVDKTGKRYGRLLVLERAENIGSAVAWLCLCDCGRHTIVAAGNLRSGHTCSCGCLWMEALTVNGKWANGNYPNYPPEWTTEFRESVRGRDGYHCRVCNTTKKQNGRALDVHHIDYNPDNTIMENCVALCRSCHGKTHHDHDYWYDYFIGTTWHKVRSQTGPTPARL